MRALRAFWASAVIGGLLFAAGSALLLSAYERNASDGLPQYWTGEGGTILMGPSIFSSGDQFDPTLWYAAGTGLILAAAAALVVAARHGRS